jgi:hypothetical protein
MVFFPPQHGPLARWKFCLRASAGVPLAGLASHLRCWDLRVPSNTSAADHPRRLLTAGFTSPRSEREAATTDALSFLPIASWVSFSSWQKARILREHFGTPFMDLQTMRNLKAHSPSPNTTESNLYCAPLLSKLADRENPILDESGCAHTTKRQDPLVNIGSPPQPHPSSLPSNIPLC